MEETNGEAEGTTIAEDHSSSEGDMERKHSEILFRTKQVEDKRGTNRGRPHRTDISRQQPNNVRIRSGNKRQVKRR